MPSQVGYITASQADQMKKFNIPEPEWHAKSQWSPEDNKPKKKAPPPPSSPIAPWLSPPPVANQPNTAWGMAGTSANILNQLFSPTGPIGTAVNNGVTNFLQAGANTASNVVNSVLPKSLKTQVAPSPFLHGINPTATMAPPPPPAYFAAPQPAWNPYLNGQNKPTAPAAATQTGSATSIPTTNAPVAPAPATAPAATPVTVGKGPTPWENSAYVAGATNPTNWQGGDYQKPYVPEGYDLTEIANPNADNTKSATTGYVWGLAGHYDAPENYIQLDARNSQTGQSLGASVPIVSGYYYNTLNGRYYPIATAGARSYSGGGGGGGSGPASNGGLITPTPTTTLVPQGYNTTPPGWKGIVTGISEQAAEINAAIPFMSAEDAATSMKQLYQMYPKEFAGYKNPQIPPPPNGVQPAQQRWFTSAERAKAIMDTLNKMAAARGGDTSTGFRYLNQVLDLMTQFGGSGTNSQTKQQQDLLRQQLAAIAPMGKEYAGLVNFLVNPTITGGVLNPVDKTGIHGSPIAGMQ